ncbi:MAG: hypothetical protein KJO17_01845 [Acidimicrobiia bacterium]|nr:hypothetical protein [Acidimicrobiia bacterium]
MRALFAIALGVGFLGLLGWIVTSAVAASVDGWEGIDPDERLGTNGRTAVAGVFGFGMAGLSAAYAGWPTAATAGAAIVGAIAAGAIARLAP